MAVVTVGVSTAFVIGSSAVAVCATNTGRRGLIIQNQDGAGNALTVGFGTNNAVTTLNGITVLATATSTQGSLAYGPFVGSLVLGPMQPLDTGKNSLPPVVPAGDVSLISTISNLKCSVIEW